MSKQINDKCKILFVIPSLRRSGAEMQVVDLLLGFDRRRFEILIFTFDEDLSLKDKLRECQLTHVNHIRKHKFDFSMVPAISQIIDDKKIDVVHTTLQIALLFGWLGCKLSKRRPPIVHSLHKMVGKNRKEKLLDRYVYNWPMKSASRVIFVCEKQMDDWCEEFAHLRSKGVVIYNGISIHKFNKNAIAFDKETILKKLGVPKTSDVISCIAGFRPVKNHSVLIQAFAMVASELPNAYLLLAGDGPELDNIEKMVYDLNLKKRVVFCGAISDIREILLASDFTVIPSNSEALSLAMLESMAMSRPVISTDVGGHKEVIVDGISGAIVPTGNIYKLAQAMQIFLKDRTLLNSMSEEACRIVRQKFTVEMMIENTERIVTEVC